MREGSRKRPFLVSAKALPSSVTASPRHLLPRGEKDDSVSAGALVLVVRVLAAARVQADRRSRQIEGLAQIVDEVARV